MALFGENGAGITAAPPLGPPLGLVLPAAQTSKAIDDLDQFNKQWDPSMVGVVAATSARPDGGSIGGMSHDEKEKNRLRQSQLLVRLSTGFDIPAAIGRLTFSLADLQSSREALTESRDLANERHHRASQQISVSAGDVAIDPKTGLPMTRAQYVEMNNKGRVCGGLRTAEDLHGGDIPFTDISGNYYDVRQVTEADSALALAQEHDSLIKQIEDGTIDYADLNPDQQLIILQAQAPEDRMARYKEQDLSPQEIEALEANVSRFQLQNRPDLLGDLSRWKPDITVNDGTIKPGAYSMETLTSTFSGAMAGVPQQPTARFAAPFTEPRMAFQPAPAL